MEPRRTEVQLTYEGVNITEDIAPYLVSFQYTDNGTSRADDLQLTLQDRDGRWRSPWMPADGDRIAAEVVMHNWIYPGSRQTMHCGTFQVDQLTYSGPSDTLHVGAVSWPVSKGLKNEEKSKAWEKVTLRKIAETIASSAGLKLLYDTIEASYDRIDQTQQSDISFLAQLAEKEGATVKVTNDTIVIYDDLRFESVPPVRTIERGMSDVLTYSFERNVVGSAYASCTVTYRDSAKNRNIAGTFAIPGAIGPTLKINERVESEAEAIRFARNALRQRNRDAQRGTITLVGDPKLVQGVTVELRGYGKFDSTYFIDSATHTVGNNGYVTRVEIRKVLTF